MTILRCPTCYVNGTKQNLAEILPGGVARILRSNPYQQDFTIIEGEQFSISCGKCNTLVYYKHPKLTENVAREYILKSVFNFVGTFMGGTQ